jgi:hypothetical protein
VTADEVDIGHEGHRGAWPGRSIPASLRVLNVTYAGDARAAERAVTKWSQASQNAGDSGVELMTKRSEIAKDLLARALIAFVTSVVEDRESYEEAFAPHGEYSQVLEIVPVVTAQEAQRILVKRASNASS